MSTVERNSLFQAAKEIIIYKKGSNQSRYFVPFNGKWLSEPKDIESSLENLFTLS